jgi:hypothetical protein
MIQIIPCVSRTFATYSKIDDLRVHAWGLNSEGETVGLVEFEGSPTLVPADGLPDEVGEFEGYETKPPRIIVAGEFGGDELVGVLNHDSQT